MSALFPHNKSQAKLAKQAIEDEERRSSKKVYTKVIPIDVDGFTKAEDYHQKFQLRKHTDLTKGLHADLAKGDAFIDSAVASRLNGFIGKHGDLATLNNEIGSYGLSPKAEKYLRQWAESRL
eukprot:TRINITY_DN2904_c0_g1_i1.p1 TRINITY_DN2904_c0_g1~~TRINITY_DN2904_c0_g1_i1.p1  ORF type:complete len:122 (-),score=32.64 TRINITY_DN2904_c0_g1_i1:270-635(-)